MHMFYRGMSILHSDPSLILHFVLILNFTFRIVGVIVQLLYVHKILNVDIQMLLLLVRLFIVLRC